MQCTSFKQKKAGKEQCKKKAPNRSFFNKNFNSNYLMAFSNSAVFANFANSKSSFACALNEAS